MYFVMMCLSLCYIVCLFASIRLLVDSVGLSLNSRSMYPARRSVAIATVTNYQHALLNLGDSVLTMGGANIGVGGHYPHLAKVRETEGQIYRLYIIRICNN